MSTGYLHKALRCLPEALADARFSPFYDRDVDTLARRLLSENGFRDYEAFVQSKTARREGAPQG